MDSDWEVKILFLVAIFLYMFDNIYLYIPI